MGIICFQKLDDGFYAYDHQKSSSDCHATQEMIQDFKQNGYIIVKKLMSESETQKLYSAFEQSEFREAAAFNVPNPEGLKFTATQWAEPGNDIFGTTARIMKVLQVSEELLDRGELYMYSGKVVMKQPKTGGSLPWHQDYGYWYKNRCIFPDFISCFVALTKCDRENGGLQIARGGAQGYVTSVVAGRDDVVNSFSARHGGRHTVIKGSSRCGRLAHGNHLEGADKERIALLEKQLQVVHCDIEAGDAIFFHGNTLHRSDPNRSEHKRWALIYSYNTKINSPDKEHYNACYKQPLLKLPSDALEKCHNASMEKRNYMDPKMHTELAFGKE